MAHEDLSRDYAVAPGSERSFGFLLAAAFSLFALLPLRHGENPRLWAIVPAVALAGLAASAPATLRPLNRLWVKLGLTLQKITNPLIMGVLFFGVFTPIALVFRLRGADPLNRAFDKSAGSYWNSRAGESNDMRRQF